MTQQENAHRAELVHVDAGHAPIMRRAVLSRELLKEEAEQRKLLGEYVKQEMKEGTDYGKIPGTEKPTLLKPGAEKLVALFHCSPEFILVQEQCVMDFDKGFFKYTFRCVIRGPGGAVLAEGYGSANSREGRYRWRDARRKCPECGHGEALLKSKKEPGFFCWEKKGGCGSNFGPKDTRITEQQVGKVENPDIADLDNTILKMAKKRAHVDGAIALARCSDMFTQDVEDLTHPGHESDAQNAQKEEDGGAPVARSAVVAFGPHKGKALPELSDGELNETIDLAHQKLLEQPKAKWAKAMREQLGALEAEAEFRGKVPPVDPPAVA